MSNELAHDFSPILKVYKDGRVERLRGADTVPPSLDPDTGVHSKDVVICPETGVSGRLYVPNPTTNPPQKLPLLVYFHGGGFLIESASSPTYHNHLNALAAQANVVVLSVDYRLAPEHPLPAAYDDSWSALRWVASGDSDEWLSSRADRRRVYLAGDSAGGNLAHYVALKFGVEGGSGFGGGGVELRGIVVVHPYFLGGVPIEPNADGVDLGPFVEGLWRFAFPGTTGTDDPRINPGKDPGLGRLGCGRVMVCVAEKDVLRGNGLHYGDVLRKSGWGGAVEVVETKGENHVFHLLNPGTENAAELINTLCRFFNANQDV